MTIQKLTDKNRSELLLELQPSSIATNSTAASMWPFPLSIINMSFYDDVEMYKQALIKLQLKITERQMKMLFWHYYAPNKTLSILYLAKLAGYAGPAAGKLQYGKLARAISEASGIAPPTTDQTSTIAEWSTVKDDNGHGQWIMYDEFATALEELGWVAPINAPAEVLIDLDSIIFSKEGRKYSAIHLRRERNQGIVDAKKRQVLQENHRLACEACGFDFKMMYGELGENFCEVHHKIPLASAGNGVHTELSDLAIVCSNCHRMLHRHSNLMSVDTLRTLVSKSRV